MIKAVILILFNSLDEKAKKKMWPRERLNIRGEGRKKYFGDGRERERERERERPRWERQREGENLKGRRKRMKVFVCSVLIIFVPVLSLTCDQLLNIWHKTRQMRNKTKILSQWTCKRTLYKLSRRYVYMLFILMWTD